MRAELPRNPSAHLKGPKTGELGRGGPNTMFVFCLRLFSGSQNDSLKQEVSFKTGQW